MGKNTIQYYWLLGGIFALLVFSACNKEATCLQYATIGARVDFKTLNDSLKTKDTVLLKPILLFETFGLINDNVSAMRFTLNSTADSMQFLIAADSAKAIFDTIKLNYTRTANFVSKECGYNYYYTLQSARSSHVAIKKIEIIQPLISDNINAKHLQVYY